MSDELTTSVEREEALIGVRLDRARRVDPAADESSVQRFWDELAEAGSALDSVESGNAALPVAFSATWPDQRQS